jgi:hypothetical protein
VTFFDEQGGPIQFQQWLKTYEPYYFLNGPTRGQRINGRNQSSRFVEDQVCALLARSTTLSQQDLTLCMAWKIGGLIDHRGSEAHQKIEYLQNWPAALTAAGQYGTRDFSRSIPFLANSMSTLLKQISQGNPRYLFDLVPQLAGFGNVYILTVLFFVSHGRFPIYDRYAHIAAEAIAQDLRPDSRVHYRDLQKWDDYDRYMDLLRAINKARPEQPGSASMFISRPVDRALWVYGHFFQTGDKSYPATKPAQTYPDAPMRSAYSTGPSKGVLSGRIRDLCQTTSDGWRRREIIVRQGVDGYPRERDQIRLIDSSGATYDLPFIKGAGIPGYTCLGKPGTLKPWFLRHYAANKIDGVTVYLRATDRPNEYRIYTGAEWADFVLENLNTK